MPIGNPNYMTQPGTPAGLPEASNPAPAKTPEEQAALDWQIAQAQNNVANSGGDLGALWNNPEAYNRSALRYDQTNAERTAQQQQNFMLGGYADYANDASAAARGAVAPYAGNLGQYGTEYFNQQQVGAGMYGMGTGGLYGTAGALNNYAEQGPGPSVAQAQHDANTAQAMRQQLAMAGSGRGAGGGAAAFRQAGANQAQIAGQANAQTAMLQAQEAQNWRQAQLQAMGQAGQLYGQGAGIGADYAQGMGGLASEAQQGAGEMTLGGEQLVNQIQGTALGGSQAYEQNLSDIYGIDKTGQRIGDSGGMTTKDWIGLSASAAGTAAMFASDIRAKTNIQPTSSMDVISVLDERQAKEDAARQLEKDQSRRMAAGQMLAGYGQSLMGSDIRAKTQIAPDSALSHVENAGSYSYNYLDPARHGEGTYVGPMAQELEGAPGVVYEQPDGTKAIDPGRLTAVNTSAIAELNRKVDALAGEGTPSDFNPYTDMPVSDAPRKAKARKPAQKLAEGEQFGPPTEFEHRMANTYDPNVYDDEDARQFERRIAGAYSPDDEEFKERMAGTYLPDEAQPEAVRSPARARPAAVAPAPVAQPQRPAASPYAASIGGAFQPIGSGRRVPILGQSATTVYDPNAAPQPARPLTQAEEDEIERQFFDPTDRYRTVGL